MKGKRTKRAKQLLVEGSIKLQVIGKLSIDYPVISDREIDDSCNYDGYTIGLTTIVYKPWYAWVYGGERNPILFPPVQEAENASPTP